MPLILPDFKGRKCLDVIVCGVMPVTEYPQKDKLSATDDILVAEYEKSGRKVFMRLVPPFPGDKKDEMHIHLEFSVADRSTRANPPATNSTPEDVIARI